MINVLNAYAAQAFLTTLPSSLKLLLNMEGANGGTTFADESPSAHTVTVNSVVTSTTAGRFKQGTSSALFDSSGDYLEVADSDDFDFGTGAFTIALWSYHTDTADFLIGQRNGNAGPHWSLIKISTGIEFQLHTAGTNVSIVGGGDVRNRMVHHSVSRNASGLIRLRQDGKVWASVTEASAMDAISVALRLGTYLNDGSAFRMIGNIDAAWIVKGEDLFDTADPIIMNDTITAAPQFFIAPKIDASAGRATGDTLTISSGFAWPGTTSYSYQWKRDGVDISGATTSSYQLQAGDVGTVTSCTVTAGGTHGSVATTAVLGHRYWRVNVTAVNGSTVVGIAEISMHRTTSQGNETSGGTASASTQFSGNEPASEAFDGIVGVSGNCWASSAAGFPQWIRYDFGAGTSPDIRRLGITSRASGDASQAPKDFTLQWSDDASSWTTALTVTNQTGWGNYETRYFDI